MRALAAALTDVSTRHEVLRTVYPDLGGVPCQHILEPAPLAVAAVDRTEGELHETMEAVIARPFDLTSEPPLRVTLIRTGDTEHVLLLLLHHIAVDGWSLAPLLSDLSRAYSARLDGAAPGWPPPPVQYADYTLRQRDLLGDGELSVLAEQLGFWTGALAGLPDELALPTDRSRSASFGYHGALVPVELDAGLHDALAGLAAGRHRRRAFLPG